MITLLEAVERAEKGYIDAARPLIEDLINFRNREAELLSNMELVVEHFGELLKGEAPTRVTEAVKTLTELTTRAKERLEQLAEMTGLSLGAIRRRYEL